MHIAETRSILHNFDLNKFAVISTILIIIARESALFGIVLTYLKGNNMLPLHGFWYLFWSMEGVAAQYIAANYFQASEFGVLILFAIALGLRNYWRTAVIMLAIAVNFHFSYSIHSGVLVVVFAGWIIKQQKYKLALQLLILFGVMVLPITLYAASFLNDPLAQIANKIWTLEALPGHSIPSVFWHSGNTIKMLTIIAGALICWYFRLHLLAIILATGFSFVTLGLLYVYFSDNYTVALLFPWRATVYLVPLASIIIFTTIMLVSTIFLKRYLPNIKYIEIFLIILLCLEIFASVQRYSQESLNIDYRLLLFDEVSSVMDIDDIILLPVDPMRDWQDARLRIKRAIYVDIKSIPVLGKDVVEWWDRVQFVRSFYRQSLSDQLRLCKDVDVDYFLTDQNENNIEFDPILQTNGFYLYECQ